MQIDLSKKEFRRLLDMVYIGNWILNSTRGDDRFADYDDLESKLFALCREQGMDTLVERYEGTDVPSRAFSDGGIHEAIMDYEDTVFYGVSAGIQRQLRGACLPHGRLHCGIRGPRDGQYSHFRHGSAITENANAASGIGVFTFLHYPAARQYGSAPSACKALTVSAADRGMESTYKLSV